MEINAVNQILKKEENYIWKKNKHPTTYYMKNKYTHFCLNYLQNKHKTHGKHSSHSSRHVNNDMCAPPPQNNASCTMLVIWRVKCLAATFRHVQGHIHICWLSVCRSFVISTFVMCLPCRVNVLYKYTDYNFDFFKEK